MKVKGKTKGTPKKILFFRSKESYGKATNQESNQSIQSINQSNYSTLLLHQTKSQKFF
jgi:hypothetical protein